MTKTAVVRILLIASLAAVVAAAPPPRAAGPKKLVTVTGEILDLGCYLSRGLTGQIHRECALKCITNGVPMGLITADSTLYLLTPNHDRAMDPTAYGPPDPFVVCKQNAAVQMSVTGLIWERKGILELEVKAAKVAPAPPPATP